MTGRSGKVYTQRRHLSGDPKEKKNRAMQRSESVPGRENTKYKGPEREE